MINLHAILIMTFLFIAEKLDLVSQELVKLAKDNGSSDNISIVVVFLKPIDELVDSRNNMELPVTKDENTTNGTMNNNDKEVLYDGITSTSIYVGKEAIELNDGSHVLDLDDHPAVGVNSLDQSNELRKISSSSASSSGAGSEANSEELKSNNPFASPDGGKTYI